MPAPGLQVKGEVGIRLTREHTHWAQCSQMGFHGKKGDQPTPFFGGEGVFES